MAAHQAPPSLGFSRQEHCSGLPFPSPMQESESEVVQLCPTLRDPMDCSLSGSSIHGIFQARVGCHCLLQSFGFQRAKSIPEERTILSTGKPPAPFRSPLELPAPYSASKHHLVHLNMSLPAGMLSLTEQILNIYIYTHRRQKSKGEKTG